MHYLRPTFLKARQPALASTARYGIKVAVNAGGADPKLLHATVVKTIDGQGMKLNVAWVEGDDVLETVK